MRNPYGIDFFVRTDACFACFSGLFWMIFVTKKFRLFSFSIRASSSPFRRFLVESHFTRLQFGIHTTFKIHRKRHILPAWPMAGRHKCLCNSWLIRSFMIHSHFTVIIYFRFKIPRSSANTVLGLNSVSYL